MNFNNTFFFLFYNVCFCIKLIESYVFFGILDCHFSGQEQTCQVKRGMFLM